MSGAMAGYEATIERRVCVLAMKRFGVENAKWGVSGWPDRCYFIPGGRPFFIEYKKPGEKPSPLQAERIRVLKLLGYDVEVHSDRDEALAAIEQRIVHACKT